MSRGDYSRWNAKRTTAVCLCLSLAAMKRHGCMTPRSGYSWRWSRNGESAGSIGFDLTEDTIIIRYTTKDREGKPLDVVKPVSLARTDCHFGGERTWFLCDCGRRVTALYIHRQHVACRHCLNLTYPSQNDSCPVNRQWRKIRKLEAKLPDDGRRPKGMHRQTFTLLRWKLMDAQARKDEIFIGESMRRFPSLGRML